MAIANLDRQQGFALIAEVTSARNLLAYGIHVIRTGAFIDTTRDPILTMMSIGMEKLYKLTLGLIALDRDHKWPTKTEMKAWGHCLVPMHEAVMDELRTRAGQSQYVRGLVAEVAADPLVVPIIDALDMYGRMGRFFYLDQLGDDPQLASPEDAWQSIEEAALAEPAIAELYGRAMKSLDDDTLWDEFVRALHARIATAAERVWITLATCGRNHVLGETGRIFGFEVHPGAVGRQ